LSRSAGQLTRQSRGSRPQSTGSQNGQSRQASTAMTSELRTGTRQPRVADQPGPAGATRQRAGSGDEAGFDAEAVAGTWDQTMTRRGSRRRLPRRRPERWPPRTQRRSLHPQADRSARAEQYQSANSGGACPRRVSRAPTRTAALNCAGSLPRRRACAPQRRWSATVPATLQLNRLSSTNPCHTCSTCPPVWGAARCLQEFDHGVFGTEGDVQLRLRGNAGPLRRLRSSLRQPAARQPVLARPPSRS
jgi:hypothetical protein